MYKRIASATAVAAIATLSLAGCGAKDAVNKAKDHAGDLSSNPHVQAAKSKGAQMLKSKAAEMKNGASGSAAGGAASGGVDLGKFSSNANAKAVGDYYTARQSGDLAGVKAAAAPKPAKAAKKYIAKHKGEQVAFVVDVVGVKGNKVSACIGPKGKNSKLVVVRKGKVAAVKKGTASCA